MPRTQIDLVTRILGGISVAFGAIALALACIGIGTPNWYVGYSIDNSSGNSYQSSSANFFYSCDYFFGGSTNKCVGREGGIHFYPTFAGVPWYYEYSNRIRDAGALCIVGIAFLAMGIVLTLVIIVVFVPIWLYFTPPVAMFLACLFMVVGMAEGARFFIYNGYSVILFETALVLTIFSLLFSAFTAGRIQLARWTDAGINKPIPKQPVSETS